MLRNFGRGLLAVAALVGAAGAAEAQDSYTLRYKFRPGMFAHYEVSNKTMIETRFADTLETNQNETQAWKQFRVISADEQGQATLEPMIDRVKMTVKLGSEEPITFDSASPGAVLPGPFQKVSDSVGKPLARLQVTARGELIKVTPLAADVPGLTDKSSNFLIVFPEAAVKVGEKWKDTFEVPITVSKGLNRPFTLRREYTLVSVAGQTATIKQSTRPLGIIEDPQVEMQLMQRMPNTEIVFDLERGLIVSQTTKVDSTVVNALGPRTQVSAVCSNVETLVSAPPAVAAGAAAETK